MNCTVQVGAANDRQGYSSHRSDREERRRDETSPREPGRSRRYDLWDKKYAEDRSRRRDESDEASKSGHRRSHESRRRSSRSLSPPRRRHYREEYTSDRNVCTHAKQRIYTNLRSMAFDMYSLNSVPRQTRRMSTLNGTGLPSDGIDIAALHP